jgi:hypothetical protein
MDGEKWAGLLDLKLKQIHLSEKRKTMGQFNTNQSQDVVPGSDSANPGVLIIAYGF